MLAKAKPRRPSRMIASSVCATRENEMQTIHPAIVSAARAKRRFSAACRLWKKTNSARLTSVAQRANTPSVCKLIVANISAR